MTRRHGGARAGRADRRGHRFGQAARVTIVMGWLIAGGGAARADTVGEPAAGSGACPAQRPVVLFNRWQEDWSVLADPCVPRRPLDALKFIAPGGMPGFRVSLGANLRERIESNDAALFGIGSARSNTYLIQRVEVHADAHAGEHWQFFVQLADARAYGKNAVTPVDRNPLDLEQAFAAYSGALGGGTLKFRIGRQEMAFDLQRFIAVRDGPNVRQAFDALWVDYEYRKWRFIAYATQPVQNRNAATFDDVSNRDLTFSGVRFERQSVGPGDLSGYWSRYDRSNARFIAVQIDAASGDRHPHDGRIGTFNPLFPNGYYFTLAGYTGYSNLIHVKPSVTLKPTANLALLGALGFQWRETTGDAIYLQGNQSVPGSAGNGSLWTGMYAQLRADWTMAANLIASVEAVHFQVGDTIRRAGGRNADYVGVELKYGW